VKALASPAGLATVTLLFATAAHPAFDLSTLGSSAPLALPLLALLFALAVVLAARAGGLAAGLIALGITLALAATGYDALRGRSGRLTLRPEQGTQTFEEEGPGGAVLGLRPLGFDLRLEKMAADGATLAISGPAGVRPAVSITPRQAVAEGGLRLGWREYDDAPLLALSLSRGADRLDFELSGTAPASVDGAAIQLVRHFPDFAMDARNQPYSRSAEFRNPGALLEVRRDGRTWPVFVLGSVSGPQQFNQITALDWTFDLASMTREQRLSLGVHREPAGLAVAVGVGLALVGLALRLRP
jgi:hypothetical protein